jgi:hypothetical protein
MSAERELSMVVLSRTVVERYVRNATGRIAGSRRAMEEARGKSLPILARVASTLKRVGSPRRRAAPCSGDGGAKIDRRELAF